ncbi:MAG: hypothetical protein WC139_03335 [Candidatus Kapaibacterium sp.]
MIIELYPFYLSPKILKIRALIKLEYYNEAENELNSIEKKVQNKDLIELLRSSIEEFRSKQTQAKIFYNEMLSDLDKFEDYEEYFKDLKFCRTLPENNNPELTLIDSEFIQSIENDTEFISFKEEIKRMSLDLHQNKKGAKSEEELKQNNIPSLNNKDSLLGNVKIITETIADVLAKQGLNKEAFDAYTLLLRAGHRNKKNILDKISELERRM